MKREVAQPAGRDMPAYAVTTTNMSMLQERKLDQSVQDHCTSASSIDSPWSTTSRAEQRAWQADQLWSAGVARLQTWQIKSRRYKLLIPTRLHTSSRIEGIHDEWLAFILDTTPRRTELMKSATCILATTLTSQASRALERVLPRASSTEPSTWGPRSRDSQWSWNNPHSKCVKRTRHIEMQWAFPCEDTLHIFTLTGFLVWTLIRP